jgi:hypothetical protein
MQRCLRAHATRSIAILFWIALFVVGSLVSVAARETAPNLLRDDHPELGGWITFIEVPDIGRIAVHIQQPSAPRYDSGAPVVVNVSGFFTATSGFDFEWEPDALGVIYIPHIP